MSLQSPFELTPTERKIPSNSKILELLGKQDLVKERYTVSQQPYSGGNLATNGVQLVQHRLFNNADYADMSTAYLTFNTTTTGGANTNNLQFDDNILSIFNIARVLVNDQLVEEIQNFNIYVNILTYGSMNKSVYETSGSFMGLYRHSSYISTGGPIGALSTGNPASGTLTFTNPSNFGGGVPFTPAATTGLSPNDVWANSRVVSASYSVPLTGYFGMFSLEKYLPLRNLASVTLELYLQPVAGCLYNNTLSTGGGIPADTVVKVEKQYINIDMVRMADAYYELMDEELLQPQGMGTQLVVNTSESVTASVPSINGTTMSTILLSKGTRYLKSVWSVIQPTSWANNGKVPSNSCFPISAYESHQMVVNSRRFPQLKVQSVAQAYQELMKSFGKYATIVGDSVITAEKYQLASTDGTVTKNNQLACFIIGQNFEQVINDEIQLQGLDTQTAGFQIQLEFYQNGQAPVSTVYSFVHFAKILKLQAGSIQIVN